MSDATRRAAILAWSTATAGETVDALTAHVRDEMAGEKTSGAGSTERESVETPGSNTTPAGGPGEAGSSPSAATRMASAAAKYRAGETIAFDELKQRVLGTAPTDLRALAAEVLRPESTVGGRLSALPTLARALVAALDEGERLRVALTDAMRAHDDESGPRTVLMVCDEMADIIRAALKTSAVEPSGTHGPMGEADTVPARPEGAMAGEGRGARASEVEGGTRKPTAPQRDPDCGPARASPAPAAAPPIETSTVGLGFVCAGCQRRVPDRKGADDDMPDHCDACWAKAHRAPVAAPPVETDRVRGLTRAIELFCPDPSEALSWAARYASWDVAEVKRALADLPPVPVAPPPSIEGEGAREEWWLTVYPYPGTPAGAYRSESQAARHLQMALEDGPIPGAHVAHVVPAASRDAALRRAESAEHDWQAATRDLASAQSALAAMREVVEWLLTACQSMATHANAAPVHGTMGRLTDWRVGVVLFEQEVETARQALARLDAQKGGTK